VKVKCAKLSCGLSTEVLIDGGGGGGGGEGGGDTCCFTHILDNSIVSLFKLCIVCKFFIYFPPPPLLTQKL